MGSPRGYPGSLVWNGMMDLVARVCDVVSSGHNKLLNSRVGTVGIGPLMFHCEVGLYCHQLALRLQLILWKRRDVQVAPPNAQCERRGTKM